MANDARVSGWAAKLAWLHAFVFTVIALACYLAPETAFGDSAWLPLARLAVLLFAAALSALVVVLVGSARSGVRRHLGLTLLAALVLDVQFPIAMFAQPASLEYVHSALGIPWFVIPLTFLVMVGMTAHCLLGLRHSGAVAATEERRQRQPAS